MTKRVPDWKQPVHPLDGGDPDLGRDGTQETGRARAREAFRKLKALRKSTMLGGLSWKGLRDDGRP